MLLIAIAAQFGRTQIVGHDDNEVRPLGRGELAGRHQAKQDQQCESQE
jgi:hypothetical protein